MRGTIAVMDHTGHTKIDLDGMTTDEVLTEFRKIVNKPSEGGRGAILAAGTDLSDMTQVRTEEEFLGIIQASEKADTEPRFLARSQVVGG